MSLSVHGLRLPYFIACLLIISSCADKTSFDDILTSTASRKDYLDIIAAEGTLEAVSTISYVCPMVFMGDPTILYLIEEGSQVRIGDTLCILEARELVNQHMQALIDLETAEVEYVKTRADLDMQYILLESEVKNIEASTEIIRLDSLQLKFTTPSSQEIIRLELEKAEVQRSSIMKKLEFLKRINASELQKMKLRISQNQRQVDQTEQQLSQLVLVAGVEGFVIHGRSFMTGSTIREGDVVWTPQPLVQIPDLSQMQVKMNVSESVYKRLVTEQPVKVTVDAFPDIVMDGRIRYKAPVGKPVKRESEVKVFEVTISLDSSTLEIQPGLAVSCDIVVNSIQDTIVVPIVSLFDQDSVKVVYIAENNGFTKREITVSEYNNIEAVVNKGLEGDEVLALMKPPEYLILDIQQQ